MTERAYIDIVFDGPPGPNTDGHHCNFVETEDQYGAGMSAGEWLQREDFWWVLRIKPEVFGRKLANLGLATTRELLEEIKTRGELGSYPEERDMAIGAANLLASMPGSVLDYRTVSNQTSSCGPTGDEMFCACGCGGDDSRCPLWMDCYRATPIRQVPETHTCCKINGLS